MDDLVTWLRAQLDEDEEVACATPVAKWTRDSAWLADMLDPIPSQRYERALGWQPMVTVEDADHIARHDPARVLREVEAKRRILDTHSYTDDGWNPGENLRCTECGHIETVAGVGQRGSQRRWPCVTVRLLTLPYADRPGYRADWKP